MEIAMCKVWLTEDSFEPTRYFKAFCIEALSRTNHNFT